MNVVLQVMVNAQYAGVYFSVNPTRAEEGAVLEYVEGLGESLVSGQVNPFRIFKKTDLSEGPLSRSILNKVFELGTKVEEKLSQKIETVFTGRSFGINFIHRIKATNFISP